MKHPEPSDWLAYLEGESSLETARQLAEHLKACAECAAEVTAWRHNIHRLQTWRWPAQYSAHPSALSVAVKWGIAALLVLGLGISLSRWAGPNARQLQAGVAVRLRTELRQELQADLLAALADDNRPVKNGFQQQLRAGFSAALARTAATSARQRQQLAEDIQQAVLRGRLQDRREVIGLLDHLQRQLAGEYLALRQDVENLATLADAGLQQTRWQLSQLTATSTPVNNKP